MIGKSKVVSFLMAVAVTFGSVSATMTAEAADAATGKDITLADYALENNMLKYDSSLSYVSDLVHLQGLCVDDTLGYMYLSYGESIVKMDMKTGCAVGSITGFGNSVNMVSPECAHVGSLEYHNGYIYAGLICQIRPENAPYCALTRQKSQSLNKKSMISKRAWMLFC